jgi:hypothetical protein
MIDNIDFKVLPAGEGKTRWLVGRAYEESQFGHHVVFLSHSPSEYERFLTYYRTEYGAGCPVRYAHDIENIPLDSVVLIDNLDKKVHHSLFDLDVLKEKCLKILATKAK